MRDYHQSEDQATWDTPLIKAFAFRAWAIENNPWGGVDRVTEGYISQEASRQRTA